MIKLISRKRFLLIITAGLATILLSCDNRQRDNATTYCTSTHHSSGSNIIYFKEKKMKDKYIRLKLLVCGYKINIMNNFVILKYSIALYCTVL